MYTNRLSPENNGGIRNVPLPYRAGWQRDSDSVQVRGRRSSYNLRGGDAATLKQHVRAALI